MMRTNTSTATNWSFDLVELRESLRSEYSVGQTLKEQLAEAVEHEQYERAAQLRDELTRRETN